MNVYQETASVFNTMDSDSIPTIPEIVLCLRGSIRGDVDPIGTPKLIQIRDLLARRRREWEPSDDPLDSLMLSIVQLGKEMADKEIDKRTI